MAARPHNECVGRRWLSSTCCSCEEEGDFSTEVVCNEDFETTVERHVTTIFRVKPL